MRQWAFKVLAVLTKYSKLCLCSRMIDTMMMTIIDLVTLAINQKARPCSFRQIFSTIPPLVIGPSYTHDDQWVVVDNSRAKFLPIWESTSCIQMMSFGQSSSDLEVTTFEMIGPCGTPSKSDCRV